jgi:hypothetical protein
MSWLEEESMTTIDLLSISPHSSNDDLARKRSVLVSARIRLAPESQPVRETAIDKILEQNLLSLDVTTGITKMEIEKQGRLCFADGAPALGRADLRKSLERLATAGRIVVTNNQGPKRYRLSTAARSELLVIQTHAEQRLKRVVCQLFPAANDAIGQYETAFLECLCFIFSQLGEAYVRLLTGQVTNEDLVESPLVVRALTLVRQKYDLESEEEFVRGVVAFFSEKHPDYDAIKWNMAQNYYLSKALGYGGDGFVLSSELFGGAVFVLDTNVLIEALEARARYHDSFRALVAACSKLGIEFRTCQISLDELRRVAQAHRVLLEKVAAQIPVSTASKVRGIFYELYREELIARGTVDLDRLFEPFVQAMPRLTAEFGFERVDSPWFDNAVDRIETKAIAQKIAGQHEARRRRPKARASMTHDAVLLYWAQSQRLSLNRDVWVLTLDRSLLGVAAPAGTGPTKPLAITLDALIQWIAPLGLGSESDENVAGIFAEAVKQRLLPQDNFFDLRDFLVFAEMEWSCRELPAEDVEACIRHVKKQAPNLDPSSPVDREKISREIARFFVDPGRKFKREVERLSSDFNQHLADDERRRADAATEIEQRDTIIEQLRRDLATGERRQAEGAARRSLRTRTALAAAVSSVVLGGGLYVGAQLGEGHTVVERIISSWDLVAKVAGLSMTTGAAVLRKRGIQAWWLRLRHSKL